MAVFTGHFLAESQAPTQHSLGIEVLTPSLESRKPSCSVPIRWLLRSQKTRVTFSSHAPVTLVIRKGVLPPPQVQPPIEMGPWELGHLGKRSGGRGEAGGGAVPGALSRSLEAESWPRRGAGPRANLTAPQRVLQSWIHTKST